MRWHVILDGEARGPVEAATVTAWRHQGLVTPSTLVWTEGMPQWAPASQTDLVHLFESGAQEQDSEAVEQPSWGVRVEAPRPAPPPPASPTPPPAPTQVGFVRSTAGQYGPVASTPQQGSGSPFSVAALVCGCIAFLFFPIIFGPIAIVLATVGKVRSEGLATAALVIAIAGTVIGLILGLLVFAF